MGFMEEMMRRAAQDIGSDDDWKALTSEEIENIDWFQPIKDLKPGDVLKSRSFGEKTKVVEANETITVHRVGKFPGQREEGAPVRESDFTILVHSHGFIVEIAEDSRNWERA